LVPLAVLVAVFAAALPATAADVPAALTAPLHGGGVTEAESHVFETSLTREGLHVWFHTEERAPAMVGRASGTATLKLPNGQVREVALTLRVPAADGPGVYFCPMHAEVVQKTPGRCEPCGGMVLFHQDELFGTADLAGVDLAGVTAQVRVTGLKGRRKEATFSPAFPLPDVKAAPQTTGK
jgi:hypothetical protein